MATNRKSISSYIVRTVLLLLLLAVANILCSAIYNGKNLFGTTEMKEGIVSSIFNNGNYDIGIGIEGDKTLYYINRGTEQGLDIDSLRQHYLNKRLKVYYVNVFTILDPRGRLRHVNQLRIGDCLFYTELKEPAP
jgi:hypothetical protein